MDSSLVKQITDLVSGVGIPGALLLMGAWGGMKLIPSLVKFSEGITASLVEIKVVLGDMKDEMKELNNRLVSVGSPTAPRP